MKFTYLIVCTLLLFAFAANGQYQFTNAYQISTGHTAEGFSIKYLPNGDYVIAHYLVGTVKLSPTVTLKGNGHGRVYVAYFYHNDSLKWLL